MNYSISRIAACVDFSEYSLRALNVAAAMARNSKATLYIIHSAETVFEQMGLDRSLSINKGNKASDILSALASEMQSRFQVNTEIVEAASQVTEAIVQHVIRCEIDLVVMGSHGESGFRKGYLGTTTYSVIKFAPCPVLIVPATRTVPPFRRPLFPVRPILTAMRHYSLLHNFFHEEAQLDVFAYTPGSNFTKDDIRELESQINTKLDLNKFSTSTRWSESNALPQDILTYADTIKADLIILTPTIDASIRPFFTGPNMHYILNNARIPVLVINRLQKS